MLIQSNTDIDCLIDSIDPADGYLKGGVKRKQIVTIVSGENGMVVLSEEVLALLGYPEFVEFSSYFDELVISTNPKSKPTMKITYMGSKGFVQNQDLIDDLTVMFALHSRKGRVHRFHATYDHPTDISWCNHEVYRFSSISKFKVQTVETSQPIESVDGEELPGSKTLTIDRSLGGIRISRAVHQALNMPKRVQFGFCKGHLVVSTGMFFGCYIEVEFNCEEAIIRDEGPVEEILYKFGIGYQKGEFIKMTMVDCLKYDEDFYGFFALVREVPK